MLMSLQALSITDSGKKAWREEAVPPHERWLLNQTLKSSKRMVDLFERWPHQNAGTFDRTVSILVRKGWVCINVDVDKNKSEDKAESASDALDSTSERLKTDISDGSSALQALLARKKAEQEAMERGERLPGSHRIIDGEPIVLDKTPSRILPPQDVGDLDIDLETLGETLEAERLRIESEAFHLLDREKWLENSESIGVKEELSLAMLQRSLNDAESEPLENYLEISKEIEEIVESITAADFIPSISPPSEEEIKAIERRIQIMAWNDVSAFSLNDDQLMNLLNQRQGLNESSPTKVDAEKETALRYKSSGLMACLEALGVTKEEYDLHTTSLYETKIISSRPPASTKSSLLEALSIDENDLIKVTERMSAENQNVNQETVNNFRRGGVQFLRAMLKQDGTWIEGANIPTLEVWQESGSVSPKDKPTGIVPLLESLGESKESMQEFLAEYRQWEMSKSANLGANGEIGAKIVANVKAPEKKISKMVEVLRKTAAQDSERKELRAKVEAYQEQQRQLQQQKMEDDAKKREEERKELERIRMSKSSNSLADKLANLRKSKE